MWASGCGDLFPPERVPVSFIRLDRMMTETALSDNREDDLYALMEHHGEILGLLGEGIIGIGAPESPEFLQRLSGFVGDSMMSEVFRASQRVFPHLQVPEAQLSVAFGRYHTWFPERPLPRFYALVTGFNEAVITSDSLIAMALDRYLGPDQPLYAQLGVPMYLRRLMRPELLPVDCVRAWGYTEFPIDSGKERVLDHIIYEGQIMYFTKALLRELPDTLLFRFTEPQLRWCEDSEAQMWAYLAEQEYLFSTNSNIRRKLLDEGPATSVFPAESPARAAVWLGYRIVASFMKREGMSLKELMEITDARDILNRSGYRP